MKQFIRNNALRLLFVFITILSVIYWNGVLCIKNDDGIDYAVGDWVFHPKYGRGQVESFAHYSNKILFCTILFDNFGRRTLDAKLTGLEKVK